MLLRLRKSHESINTPGYGWATETKQHNIIEGVPYPFGTGAYTASDNTLSQKSSLIHETRNTQAAHVLYNEQQHNCISTALYSGKENRGLQLSGNDKSKFTHPIQVHGYRITFFSKKSQNCVLH